MPCKVFQYYFLNNTNINKLLGIIEMLKEMVVEKVKPPNCVKIGFLTNRLMLVGAKLMAPIYVQT